MAVPAENIVTNAAAQSAVSGISQGLYESSSTQKGPVGARMAFNDGRVFRYSYFVSAVSAGTLCAQDASISNVGETAATTVRDSAGTAADIASSDSVDVLYFLDTDLFTAANSNDIFAGGYVHHIASAEGGYTYRVRGNTYTAATSVMQVDLYDTIAANISSQNEMAVTGSMYNYLAIANNGTDDVVVGVPMVDAAAADYGWVQTWGVATVLADESAGTIAAGTVAVLSDGVNGAAEPLNLAAVASEEDRALLNFAEPILGHFLSAATNGNFTNIFLQIAP